MKRNLVAALMVWLSGVACAGTFQADAKDFNVPFNLSISETGREDRVSILRVEGFYARTAAATRWMMCMVNTLAVLRGYEYWTVVYPEQKSDELVGDVIVGFPRSMTEKLADSDPRFASKGAIQQVLPIERGIGLCMSYRNKP